MRMMVEMVVAQAGSQQEFSARAPGKAFKTTKGIIR